MTNPDADISDPAIADARNPKRFTITLTNGPATVGLRNAVTRDFVHMIQASRTQRSPQTYIIIVMLITLTRQSHLRPWTVDITDAYIVKVRKFLHDSHL